MNEHSAMTASSLNLLVRRDDGLSAGDDFGRRAVEPLHQRLDVSTADEAELEVHLGGLADELRVVHGGGERRAQCLAHGRIEAGRRDKWAAHGLPGKNQLQHLPIGTAGYELVEHRYVQQLVVFGSVEL